MDRKREDMEGEKGRKQVIWEILHFLSTREAKAMEKDGEYQGSLSHPHPFEAHFVKLTNLCQATATNGLPKIGQLPKINNKLDG